MKGSFWICEEQEILNQNSGVRRQKSGVGKCGKYVVGSEEAQTIACFSGIRPHLLNFYILTPEF